jgi:hypothetical protein
MPESAEILALPAAPIGATAADFCAVLAELHVESRQARRPAWRCRFLATSGKNPEVATVRPTARQSPAGAALLPDQHARILTGFLAFCTRRTRVGLRVPRESQSISFDFLRGSSAAPGSEECDRKQRTFGTFDVRAAVWPQRSQLHRKRPDAAGPSPGTFTTPVLGRPATSTLRK